VVETAAMLRHTARFESDRLCFFDSVAAAGEWLGGVDLVHTSSTVQYTPAPLATVAVLRSLAAPVVLYQRTALSDGATFHAVQRAPLANHGSARERSGSGETLLPITWLDRGAFLGAASSGYDLVVRFAGRPAK